METVGPIRVRGRRAVLLDEAPQVAPRAEWGQGLGQFAGGGGAVGGVLGEQPGDEVGQGRGHVGAAVAERRRRLVQVGLHLRRQGGVRRLAERRLADQQGEQGAAEAVQVGPDVDAVGVGPLLGGGVVERAHDPIVGGEPPGDRLLLDQRQAEVEHLDGPRAGQEEVRRLEVAVDPPRLVGVLEAQGRLADRLAGVGHGQRPPGPEDRLQVEAVEQLHDEEEDPVGLARVAGQDDVGVLEAADRLHLALEAGDRGGVGKPLGGQDLDRHQPVEPDVPRRKTSPMLPRPIGPRMR